MDVIWYFILNKAELSMSQTGIKLRHINLSQSASEFTAHPENIKPFSSFLLLL